MESLGQEVSELQVGICIGVTRISRMEKIIFWYQCEGGVSQADIWRWGFAHKENIWGGEGEEEPTRHMEDTTAVSREENRREGGRCPGCCLVEMLLLGQPDRKGQLRVTDAASKSVQGCKGQAKEGHMERVVSKLGGLGYGLVLHSGEELSSCPCPRRHLHCIHRFECSISQPEFAHQPSNWTMLEGLCALAPGHMDNLVTNRCNSSVRPDLSWTDYKRLVDLYYRNLYPL